jgi:hypothetical protein
MKLLTLEIIRKLPKLYATEDTPLHEKVFTCKFFTPWSSWTWYVTEGDRQEDGDWLFFGYVEGLEGEWGYFALSELESIDGPFSLKVERDLHFMNVPAAKVLKLEVQTA